MIDKSHIDANALHYYRLLKEAGFSAYLVGGSVRDLLLGKTPKDFDIATNATPHQIKRVIPHGRIIGRRFRHVMLERGSGRYEIVTFRGPILSPKEEAEEAAEEAQGADAPEAVEAPEADRTKRFPDLNQFGNPEQDAIRRDFTINALFYDPDADELVDYVEGKLDIDRKIIRAIGDPFVRLEEDPIRILRAIRHKMKLGLEYDPALEAAMRDKAPLLEETSKDRIREEFLKVCADKSLGQFLSESKRLGIEKNVMPWFDGLSEETWNSSVQLWQSFQDSPVSDRSNVDMGLALMMSPLVEPLVLAPYKETVQPGERNYLPDMKYFLSCETLRNYFLRNLRISRAQTDHVIRALFYYSRMTGLWIDQGPPRRVIGKLFQHPPALLAAKMARLYLAMNQKEIPDWIIELAEFDNKKKSQHQDSRPQDDSSGGGRGQPRRERERERSPRRSFEERGEREEPSPAKVLRLPTPDKPMIWNGPLHAPVLRPIFNEEPATRWARKNQTVQAFRPSGIPNKPTDYALLKANLVHNYKPELSATDSPSEDEDSERKNHRGGRRDHRSKRRDERREERDVRKDDSREDKDPQQASGSPQDEDSIGNIRMPGEAPALLENVEGQPFSAAEEDFDDIDDDIGNRLDAPPTSGHVGVNGDGLLAQPNSNQSRQGGGQNRGSGGGGNRGGRNRNRNRRGGRRHGGGGGGGQNRGFNRNPRGGHDNP